MRRVPLGEFVSSENSADTNSGQVGNRGGKRERKRERKIIKRDGIDVGNSARLTQMIGSIDRRHPLA